MAMATHHTPIHRHTWSPGIDSTAESTIPITRDFLGGVSSSSRVDVQELDLDLVVPNGYEKRLDLKSGKVYFYRCNSPNLATSPPSERKTDQTNQTVAKLHDLNRPRTSNKRSFNLFEETSLNLKLLPTSTSSSPSSCNYRSVCTLDKVKYALERVEKHSTGKKWSKSLSPPWESTAMESHKENSSPEDGLLFAAGCPNCLLYVMISKGNPKCPRCHKVVPMPSTNTTKKPRLDLNMSV